MDLKRETLNRYIRILTDAKILYECRRFDLKSKKSIAGEQKYYLSDLGFYFAANTYNRISYARLWKILYTTMPDQRGMKSALEESENWNVILFCAAATGIIVMCR